MNTALDKSIYGQIKTKGEQLAELVKMAECIQNNNDKNAAEAYQRGLDDAWDAARKIALMDTETSENVTGYFGLFSIMENLTPMQAIEKLKAYKEKQKEEAEDEIKVGDEVAFHHDDGRPDTVVVVTYIGQDGFIDGMDGRGAQYVCKNPTKWTKTGRHFDIEKILEDMRND